MAHRGMPGEEEGQRLRELYMDQSGIKDLIRSGMGAQEVRWFLQAGPALTSLPGACLLYDLGRYFLP